MDVSKTNANYGRQAYVQGTESVNAPDNSTAKTTEPQQTATEDKVSLSASVRDLQVAQDAMALAPEIRTDKVYEVQAAVQSGNYKVDAQQVADKIIGFSIDQMV